MRLLSQGRLRAPEILAPAWAGDQTPLESLRGRVILLDFFSYGDPAGASELSQVSELASLYSGAGVTTLGVHVPAYGFEQAPDAARREFWRRGIEYPVALDQRHEAFQAYGGRDLPTRVVVDAEGFVRGWHAGATGLDQAEAAIRTLLRERNPQANLPPRLEPQAAFVAMDRLQWYETPPIAFGSRRGGFGAPSDGTEAPAAGTSQRFRDLPELRAQGQAYLEGAWRLEADGIIAEEADANVSIVFEGSSVQAVISLKDDAPESPELIVRLDGESLAGEDAGADTRTEAANTTVSVDRGRVYELCSSKTLAVRHLDVTIPHPGVAIHLVAFGTTDVPEEN